MTQTQQKFHGRRVCVCTLYLNYPLATFYFFQCIQYTVCVHITYFIFICYIYYMHRTSTVLCISQVIDTNRAETYLGTGRLAQIWSTQPVQILNARFTIVSIDQKTMIFVQYLKKAMNFSLVIFTAFYRRSELLFLPIYCAPLVNAPLHPHTSMPIHSFNLLP